MREFRNGGPRSLGPPVVWAGRDDGPALVILDPSGAARHDDPPATWRPLTAAFQVAWCRIPASRKAANDIEDVLETLAERSSPVCLIASGTACPTAIAVATQFAENVHVVLLVDPPDGVESPPAGVRPRVVARSHGGTTDRVDAPMPLGHPDVVRGVVLALAEQG